MSIPDQVQADHRIADIEVLRAIAILLTLVVHLSSLFPWWLGPTEPLAFKLFDFRVGVDLFFVISGFVIARSFLPKLAEAKTSGAFWRYTLAFWVRRAWRIWPSAWVWLTLIVISTLALNSSGVFGSSVHLRATFGEALASVLQVMNFRVLDATFRPDVVASSVGATFPYWSLSLEEQFYLALPLVVLVSRRYLPLVLLAVVVAMFSIPKGPGTAASFFRFDPIVLGVLLALWRQHSTYDLLEPRFLAGGPLRKVFFTSAVTLVAVAAMGMQIVSFAHGLVGLLCALLVYTASFNRDYLFPAGRLQTVMLWIGSRSYAIYLCHVLLYFVTRELWFRFSPPESVFGGTFTLRYMVTALVLIGVASELNYRFIERPFRLKGRKIADRIEGGASSQIRAVKLKA